MLMNKKQIIEDHQSTFLLIESVFMHKVIFLLALINNFELK